MNSENDFVMDVTAYAAAVLVLSFVVPFVVACAVVGVMAALLHLHR